MNVLDRINAEIAFYIEQGSKPKVIKVSNEVLNELRQILNIGSSKTPSEISGVPLQIHNEFGINWILE